MKLPFTQLVQDKMKERGLGLRGLCRAAGLDPSFFSKVLAGKRNPPSEEAVLRRLAGVLGMEAPQLIASAGRIPSEWSRLWTDGELFHSVHQLASSDATDRALSRGSAASTRSLDAAIPRALRSNPKPRMSPERSLPVFRDLDEELL